MKLLRLLAERLDGLLDAIPAREDGRWFRYGDWGCTLGLSRFWIKELRRAPLAQWKSGLLLRDCAGVRVPHGVRPSGGTPAGEPARGSIARFRPALGPLALVPEGKHGPAGQPGVAVCPSSRRSPVRIRSGLRVTRYPASGDKPGRSGMLASASGNACFPRLPPWSMG
jgi:hypothetical protein